MRQINSPAFDQTVKKTTAMPRVATVKRFAVATAANTRRGIAGARFNRLGQMGKRRINRVGR